MPTTEERLAALETKLAQLTATTPTEYYTHKYSGEEIDDAVDKIRSGAGEGAVRFDQAQTLTPAQQEQAQHNIGTTWPCNPNLLDNCCFQIWQRYSNGSYSGVPNGSYVPDRWIITSSNGSIISNLIKATSYGGIKNSNGPNCRITQRLANAAQYNGMTLTLSMLKNTGLHPSTKVVSGWADTTDIFAGFSSATAWLNAGETIIAAKLELGPTQTLAHREGDKWVLNEVPEYGEQLRRCQRYFVHFTKFTAVSGRAANANSCQFMVPIPVTMRDKPVISDTNVTNWRVQDAAGKYITITGIHAYPAGVQPSYITIFVDSAAAFTVGAIYTLSRTDASGPVSFSADL